jgi:hypothetical protein
MAGITRDVYQMHPWPSEMLQGCRNTVLLFCRVVIQTDLHVYYKYNKINVAKQLFSFGICLISERELEVAM